MRASWPTKGDKAFVERHHGKGFTRHMTGTWYTPQHAAAFKLAAEMVLDSFEERNDYMYDDGLLFPVAYLYRHSLELKLKDLIDLGVELTVIEKSDKLIEDLGGHNLAKLWNPAKSLLLDRWPTSDPTPLLAAEQVILEFHRADPNGQIFRYQTNKDGQYYRHPTLPATIDLANLRTTMDGTFSFLEGCESELTDNLQSLRDNMCGWDR